MGAWSGSFRSYREMDKATWEIFLEGLYCNALGFEIHGAVHLQDIAAELCFDLLLKQVFGGQVGAEYQGPPFGAQGSSILNSNRQVRCRLPSLPGPQVAAVHVSRLFHKSCCPRQGEFTNKTSSPSSSLLPLPSPPPSLTPSFLPPPSSIIRSRLTSRSL